MTMHRDIEGDASWWLRGGFQAQSRRQLRHAVVMRQATLFACQCEALERSVATADSDAQSSVGEVLGTLKVFQVKSVGLASRCLTVKGGGKGLSAP